MYQFPRKYYVFNIDNNKKSLLSTKSQRFTKDHVTLKTENSALHYTKCIKKFNGC